MNASVYFKLNFVSINYVYYWLTYDNFEESVKDLMR